MNSHWWVLVEVNASNLFMINDNRTLKLFGNQSFLDNRITSELQVDLPRLCVWCLET